MAAINYLAQADAGRAGNNLADAYFKAANVAKDALGSFRDKEIENYKIAMLAKEREDRLAQQAIDNKRAEAMLKMQQNQEQRAIDALAKTDATQQAVVNYANTLSNYGKDVITAEQGDKLAALYAKNPKAVEAEVAKMQNAYNNGLQARRAMLDSITMPTTYNEVVVDPKAMLDVKTRVLDNVDDQIKTKQKQDFEKDLLNVRFNNDRVLTGMKISADAALEERRNKNILARLEKEFQQQPDQVKQAVYAADFAQKDYDKLDNKVKAKYGSVDAYLKENNAFYQTKAVNQIAYGKSLLDTKDPELSTYTDSKLYGNAKQNSDKITALQSAGYSKAQIKAAFAAASKGANELSLFGLNSPDVNLDQVDKYLLNIK